MAIEVLSVGGVVWLVWPNTDAFQSVFLVLVLCIGHVANRQSINSNQREREQKEGDCLCSWWWWWWKLTKYFGRSMMPDRGMRFYYYQSFHLKRMLLVAMMNSPLAINFFCLFNITCPTGSQPSVWHSLSQIYPVRMSIELFIPSFHFFFSSFLNINGIHSLKKNCVWFRSVRDGV